MSLPDLHHADGHHDVGGERADRHHVDELLQVKEERHGAGHEPGDQRGPERGASDRADGAPGTEDHTVRRHGQQHSREREHRAHQAEQSRTAQHSAAANTFSRLPSISMTRRNEAKGSFFRRFSGLCGGVLLPGAHGEDGSESNDPLDGDETDPLKR